jgi:Cdc6-like AAA superfamily ATPase
MGKSAKRIWNRLKWEPADIMELRTRIGTNFGLLAAFNGRVTRDNTIRLVRHQESQEQQMVLDWLTPIDYASQQSDILERRQASTGQWLLDSNTFQSWLAKESQTLFCPGNPGAGKTVISATVVDYLSTKYQQDPDVSIAYLYFDFNRKHEQRPKDLFASLLRQFIPKRPTVPEIVRALNTQYKANRGAVTSEELLKALHSVIKLYAKSLIVIDGLDECEVLNGCRSRFLSAIASLQTQCGTGIFVTSRGIPEIAESFKDSLTMEIRAQSDDVRKYLDGHISRLPAFVGKNPELQQEIQTAILAAVDGM